jgi:hypothetical protein
MDGGAITTSGLSIGRVSSRKLYNDNLSGAPVAGSNSALFKPPISDEFAARVDGLSLKFPPTKNWRVIV